MVVKSVEQLLFLLILDRNINFKYLLPVRKEKPSKKLNILERVISMCGKSETEWQEKLCVNDHQLTGKDL